MIGAGYRKREALQPVQGLAPDLMPVKPSLREPMMAGLQSSPEAAMAGPAPQASRSGPKRGGLFGSLFGGMAQPMGGRGLTRGDFLYQLGAYLKDLDPMSGGGNLDRAQAMAEARLREQREEMEAVRRRREMHETALRLGIRPDSPEYVLFMQQPEAWGGVAGAWMKPQSGMAGDRPYVFRPDRPDEVRYGAEAPASRADRRADRALSQKDREIELRAEGVGGYGLPTGFYPGTASIAPIPGDQTPDDMIITYTPPTGR